jgi:hypothetical protein
MMSHQELDRLQLVPQLQHVGSEAVAQGLAACRSLDVAVEECLFQSSLYDAGIEVMPTLLARQSIEPAPSLWEEPLPVPGGRQPLLVRVDIIGELDATPSLIQIDPMHLSHSDQMVAERFDQCRREDRGSLHLTLAITNQHFLPSQRKVSAPELQRFHEAQTTAIQKPCDQ